MKWALGGIFIAGLAVGLCVLADGAVAKNPVRPDRSRTQEMLVSSGMCDPGVTPLPGRVSQEWAGSGNVTHGGLSLIDSCIAVTAVHSLTPFVLEIAGQGSVTAANGDTVFFELTGLTNVDAGCVTTSTLQFVGGTGRFAQVSGSVDCTGVRINCGPSQMTDCAGSISY